MTLFFLIIVAGLIYYFIIYKMEYKSLFQSKQSKKCPNCSNYVEKNFNVCPICKETLKKKCLSCSEMVDISWKYCPYCEAELKNS